MGNRPSVLIVDDSAELRMVVRSRLQVSGLFDVVGEAGDGADAWMLAERLQPDLMLLDTSMPGMDGLEALPLVQAVSPDTKVVMYTGFGEAGLADRAAELGAVDFVEKSLPIEQLPERLWRHVADGDVDSVTPPLRVANDDDGEAARAQAALDEHLERFREVFSQAAIGMATLTLNGSIVRANEALAEMAHCTPDDLVGTDYGVLTEGHGEAYDHAMAQVAAGAGTVSFEHPMAKVSGEPAVVRVILAPVRDSRGEPLYVFAQVQDITPDVALRRSEQMFRLLVTAVKDYAIYMLDTDGHVVTWNNGAQHIKGYREDEIVGRHFRVFYPPEERSAGHPEHNLALALERGSYAEEGWRVRSDGSRFWASVLITPIRDDYGRHVGFAKITRDCTQQRAHDEERRHAVEQQAHLLAVTAHELRTPTAVIDGSVAMLRHHSNDVAPEQRERLLAALTSSARRLDRLVADLRTASDVQADALALSPERVVLGVCLTAAAERVRAAHPDARITVQLQTDTELTLDPARVGQALDNLLENAIRHGRPPILMSGEATATGARVCVSDGGSGVDPRLEERLFERFAHAGPTAGTGLGLHLVREIARSHGGSVSYVPAHDGTRPTFVLDLPREPRIPDL